MSGSWPSREGPVVWTFYANFGDGSGTKSSRGFSLTRYSGLRMGWQYLDFLFTQSDAAHNIHTSGLVRLRVLCVGLLKNLLVIGTILCQAGFTSWADKRSSYLVRLRF